MDRRGFLAALLVAFPAATDASPKTRRKKRKRHARETLTIPDETSGLYDGIVQHQVARLNAIMPRCGPKLVVEERGHRVCTEDATWPICSGPLSHPWAAGLAAPDHGALRDVDYPLTEKHRIVCHELMHRIAGVGDAYTYDPATGITHWWHPGADSCVHGLRSEPGTYDRMLLEKRYPCKKKKNHQGR